MNALTKKSTNTMTNDQPMNPAEIPWEANTGKLEADQTIYRAMSFDLTQLHRTNKKRLRVLSFPAQTWAWEQRLVESFQHLPMEFLGLERDAALHKKTKKFATVFSRNFAMTDKPVDFQTFATSNRRKVSFEVVYLDWMSNWSKEKKEDISALFRNGLLSVGGLLLMTVSLQRGRPETMEEMMDPSYDLPMTFFDARGEGNSAGKLKVSGIPQWIQNHAWEVYDISMRPLLASVYYYRNDKSGQAQPQLQIMMLRVS